MSYRVLLEPDDNGTFLATCADLPEVTTFGDFEVEALQHAQDAVETALQARIKRQEPIPLARSKAGIPLELPPLIEAKLAFYRAFLQSGISKAELARRLGAHGPSVDRLFDLAHDSRIGQIGAATKALGKELHFTVRPAA